MWRVERGGSIIINIKSKVKEKESFVYLPRFGLELTMPKGNKVVEYFGFGPHESYIDKHHSVRKGRYIKLLSKCTKTISCRKRTGLALKLSGHGNQ